VRGGHAYDVEVASEMNAEQLLALHTERFGRGDVDGLLSEYADDVVFITRGQVLRGPASLRPLFEAMIAEFSQPGVSFEMLAREAVGDFAYIAWKADTPNNHYQLGSDTLVLRDGKIVLHTAAIAVTPKG
jgi:ketosteroid isomerase-like protein